MPTYEYKCDSCGYVFEEFQSMTDQPLKTCPQCGEKIHRLIGTGAGLIFKGSGFYLTDYKKSNTSPSKTTSSDKAKSSEPSSAPKSEKSTPTEKEK